MRSSFSGVVSMFAAVLSACGLVAFARLYPFGAVAAGVVVVVMMALMLYRRDAWLVLVPALLPVVDLAPWSGAIHLTESDALIFCTVLAGAGRDLLARDGGPLSRKRFSIGLGWLLILLLLSSYLISTDWAPLARIFSDPALLAGYATPLNGVRVAKGYLLAVLLLPMLRRAFARDPSGAAARLVWGLVAGLVLVSLAAVYERWAFVDLSNLSSDYRTTALFWEANVGGAMIDGWMALTVPFALWLALKATTPKQGAWRVALLGLVGYAVFTTFSRGLYMGIALGCAWMLLLSFLDARRDGHVRLQPLRLAVLSGLFVVFGLVLGAVFGVGGYRGLAATMGTAFLVYLVAPIAATLPRRAWQGALIYAFIGSVLSIAAMYLVPKGVYLAYGLSALLAVALLWGRFDHLPGDPAAMVAGAVMWSGVNAALVTVFWSEGRGLLPGAVGALLVLLPLFMVGARPRLCWRPDVAGTVRVLVALGALLVLVLGAGSYYAVERFSTVDKDLSDREAHWALGASLPVGDWETWFGVGTGQYAERYYWSAPNGLLPGNHQLVVEDGNAFLRLNGPKHVLGFGELYRVSQRVPISLEGPFSVQLRVRIPGGGRIHVEICRKHLLYDGGCVVQELKVGASPEWSTLDLVLKGDGLGRSVWPPKLTSFSIANATRGRAIDVDDVSVIDGKGRSLIDNGGFTAGSDFWFFSSDRYHLPWHAKNMWLHYYVEQGVYGVIGFSLLLLGALYGASRVRMAGSGLARPLAGGLVAFSIVGVFDSLVDAPRVATLFFVLAFVALGLKAPRRPPG